MGGGGRAAAGLLWRNDGVRADRSMPAECRALRMVGGGGGALMWGPVRRRSLLCSGVTFRSHLDLVWALLGEEGGGGGRHPARVSRFTAAEAGLGDRLKSLSLLAWRLLI